MPSNLVAVTVIGVLLLARSYVVEAAHPLRVRPSDKWYGIDGNWSAVQIGVGAPVQFVDVLPNTALSEIWVVESGGCPTGGNNICIAKRGGVFDVADSSSWNALGPWELGLDYLGLGGNGDYAMETVAFISDDESPAVDNSIVAALNDTDYYQGYLGLGVALGRFGNTTLNPFISQLSETYGYIPSHSYGFTAGAFYAAGRTGSPASLTLGGYDANRFKPHDTAFRIDPDSNMPLVFVRGITLSGANLADEALVAMNDSLMAYIDSSTPYLWLPEIICERFAEVLNLTWSEKYGLYLFAEGSDYERFLNNDPFTFTFSLSSWDNRDDFGTPLNVPGMVNISVPSTAFSQLLRYPFKDLVGFEDSAVPYFPLKRTNGSMYILGRTFLQEAYLITKYDSGSFSVHQAQFPEKPYSNISLVAIDRPPDSPFPEYDAPPQKSGITTGQMVGIVVGAFAVGAVFALVLWCCLRRKRAKRRPKAAAAAAAQREAGSDKEAESDVEPVSPRSPVGRMLSRLRRNRAQKRSKARGLAGSTSHPAEVGADASHELYELPVPSTPVELETNNETMSLHETSNLGTDNSATLSPYEVARHRISRQLRGPVPAYSPPLEAVPGADPTGKDGQDVSPVAHYRPSSNSSPASSPTYGHFTHSITIPSPITPPGDGSHRLYDLPSPLTVAPPIPSPLLPSSNSNLSLPEPPRSPMSPRTINPSSMSLSSSSQGSAPSPSTGSLRPPSPTFQRTPIEPSRIICLGPLPENIQLPQPRPPIPRLVAPTGHTLPSPTVPASPTAYLAHRSAESLGSNFTIEEETRMREEVTRQQSTRQQGSGNSDDCVDSPASDRIDPSQELVHVPQLAERRYSWEEER